MKPRDITTRELARRLRSYGFRCEILGYWQLPGLGVSVNILNGGNNNRARLAYMLRELDRHEDAKRKAESSNPHGPA